MSERIIIAGVGPAGASEMTRGTRQAFLSADIIIGAGRVLEGLRDEAKETEKIYVKEYRAGRIAEYIVNDSERYPQRRYFIAVSGDSGFFSGAAGVRQALEDKGLPVTILPGISSLSYLCARAGVSWQDAVCVSAHGRELSIASEVRRSRKTFVLTGGNADALLKRLTEFGLGEVRVIAGENLACENEHIIEGSAFELSEREFGALTSLLILNEDAQSGYRFGISDDLFIRGEIPMTKSEVRAVTMSCLNIKPEDVVYDIGAGTGSVTVEAALAAYRGKVFAVEKNPMAIRLIGENCRSFSADNVEIIEGSAPAALKGLPAPDAVFLGGTGGALEEILEELCGPPIDKQTVKEQTAGDQEINPPAPEKQKILPKQKEMFRIVMNAVSVENIGISVAMFEKYGARNLEAVQISAARARRAGRYHLLNAQNPVFIISADFVRRNIL